NFCTLDFLFGIAGRGGFFVTRQHKNLPWEGVTEFVRAGRVEGAEVWEQRVQLVNAAGEILVCRRLKLVLDKPTRDGERELFLLTNLPAEDADALGVARLYRHRWTMETMFRELTDMFENEIDTLAYPKAALFGFCTGLAAYNVLSAVKAALRAVHGAEKIEAELDTLATRVTRFRIGASVMQGFERPATSLRPQFPVHVQRQPLLDVPMAPHPVDALLRLAKAPVGTLHGVARRSQQTVVQELQRFRQL